MSKSFAVKDLALFDNHNVIPDSGGVLTAITHRVPTSPVWFIDSIVQKVLHEGGTAIVATFVHRKSVHLKGIKRGSDVDTTRLRILDLSDKLFSRETNGGFRTAPGDILLGEIAKAMPETNEKCIVVIEGLDIVVGSGMWDALTARSFVIDVGRAASAGTFVTCHVDSEFVHSESLISEEHLNFATSLLHLAACVIDLAPLSTGRAHDVTGVLRVSRGPRISSDDSQVSEGEYLYHVGDSIKLFYR
jgi:elongator complex protein 6